MGLRTAIAPEPGRVGACTDCSDEYLFAHPARAPPLSAHSNAPSACIIKRPDPPRARDKVLRATARYSTKDVLTSEMRTFSAAAKMTLTMARMPPAAAMSCRTHRSPNTPLPARIPAMHLCVHSQTPPTAFRRARGKKKTRRTPLPVGPNPNRKRRVWRRGRRRGRRPRCFCLLAPLSAWRCARGCSRSCTSLQALRSRAPRSGARRLWVRWPSAPPCSAWRRRCAPYARAGRASRAGCALPPFCCCCWRRGERARYLGASPGRPWWPPRASCALALPPSRPRPFVPDACYSPRCPGWRPRRCPRRRPCCCW